MFNRTLRAIFEPNRREVAGWWKKLHRNVMKSSAICTIHSIVGTNKSRGKRWAGHLARMVEIGNGYVQY
jgi:hypothetical protein